MHTDIIRMARHEAADLHRKYKEHAAYQQPIDWEIQRTYDLIARGKVIIKALESIKNAGLNREFLPKLALTTATAEWCYLTRYKDGQVRMSDKDGWTRTRKMFSFRESTFVFPTESFPLDWQGKHRTTRSDHKAKVPPIPLHLRPRRGIQNYHIMWEAEWEPVPPKDPMLLRRIGKADLWLVVAQWELTEVERGALSTRI